MKLNLLVLMGGSSEAFVQSGYAFPKNLVEINGAPLVQHVLDSLGRLACPDGKKVICVLRAEENARFYTGAVIRLIEPMATLVELSGVTSGAACSALLAVDSINNQEPLLITNGDQILNTDLNAVIADFDRRGLDGGVVVFRDIHPRWSFVKCNEKGEVIEAAEKRPISNLATAGFYFFRQGADFVEAAQRMIIKGASVNNQFYVCPAYNELVLKQKKIGVFEIPKSAYISLATPAGVEAYAIRMAQRTEP